MTSNHLASYYTTYVQAGFASPAEDYQEPKLDLNQHLIKNPLTTFFFKMPSSFMKKSGIFLGDLVLID